MHAGSARSLHLRPTLAGRFHLRTNVEELVASDGALWVVGLGVVSRLDPLTGRIVARVMTAGTGNGSQLAVGDGSI
jgi:hypothetical protein